MREIQLTQGQFALVDDEDYDYLMQWKWYAVKCTHTWYAFRSIDCNGSRRRFPMHRDILNTPKGMETDHIDHNGLNNQRSNIRICTKNENQRNKQSRGKSRFVGVCWSVCVAKRYSKTEKRIKIYTYEGKWVAHILANGKPIHLGYYEKEEDAAKAYDRAALKYHGAFANLNFPD
jgi:hypothetical protein